MKSVLLIGIALLVSAPGLSAAAAPDGPSGLACFENLSAPEFPPAALSANIDGSVWTTVQVSPQGTVEKIETQVVSAWSKAAGLLVPPVEKVIRAARVNPQCAGKTVSVVFRYAINGDPTPSPTPTSRTLGTNTMWIESRPAGKPQV